MCPEYVDSWWPNKTKDGAVVFPYSQVLTYQAQARTNHSFDAGAHPQPPLHLRALSQACVAVPYVPIVIAGFDPRPWEEPAPSFAHPSQEEWKQALSQARDFVEAEENRKFGFPDATSGTGVQPAVIIYAWNEYGEGGILAPTAGWGDMMVTTVGQVFAKNRRL